MALQAATGVLFLRPWPSASCQVAKAGGSSTASMRVGKATLCFRSRGAFYRGSGRNGGNEGRRRVAVREVLTTEEEAGVETVHGANTLTAAEHGKEAGTEFRADDGAGSEMGQAQRVLEEVNRQKLAMGLNDTDLLSTPVHKAWVACGALAVLGMVAKSMAAIAGGESAWSAILAAVAAYILADFGTGVYHWGVDNYGDARTPVFGSQIDAFQGHHRRPWTITKRQMANNLHALTRPAFFVLLPFLFTPNNAAFDSFVGVFLGCVVMSQQCHAWSHTPKHRLPPPVLALQDVGLLVGRRMHGAHHRPPYNTNYCIVSGICNWPLDRSEFFPRMEKQIFRIWGLAPRSWGETAPEWLEEVAYYEDGLPVDSSSM